MSALLPRRLAGLALVLVFAVATSGAAVAHRLTSGGPAEEALTLYLALGGKIADLCGSAGAPLAHCDACRPLNAGPLPAPSPSALAHARFPLATLAARETPAPPRARAARLTLARGPPGARAFLPAPV